MKQAFIAATLAGALIAAGAGPASAFDPANDDTDLFLYNPAVTPDAPNVLIFLDNTANWNTRFENEKQALTSLFFSLTEQYNVGLMMYTETGVGNLGADGAYVRAAVRPMLPEIRPAYAGLVNSFDQLGDQGDNATVSLAMYEIYAYFAGLNARSGIKLKRDYTGNEIEGLDASNNVYGLPEVDGYGNALSSSTATQYNSPMTDGCQRNILIFISNGPPNDNRFSLNTAERLLAEMTGKDSPDTIALNPSGQQSNWGDEYARFMATADVNATLPGDQHVITYTVEIDPETTGQGLATTALYKSMAVNGNGKYFAVDGGDASNLVVALAQIFQEVQAVNSVIASSTLPVSVNVRGTNVNQVYIGVFRPDANKAPRWFGNLKMYKLGVDEATSSLFLADANGVPAENPSTGFITPSATSFWSEPSTFWSYRPANENGAGGASDAPDGELVEKGGVAQQLRIDYAADQTARNLYTCTASAGGYCSGGDDLSLTPFDASNADIAVADLGVADLAERADLIDWVRGEDQFDENANAQTGDIRASVHGDVLHSRPAVVNYARNGLDDENDVYAFYGSNDGIFRAVKGGSAADGGTEAWGFIPREFFGKFKRLRDDAPSLSSTDKKSYFIDGTITTYQEDVNGDGELHDADGDKVYLYLAMRRGGRLLYALDVSDPEAPVMLWRRDNTSSGFAELGQTWSAPTVANVSGYANPVLIMGMGYDAAVEDINPCRITASDAAGVTWTSGGTVTWLPGTCTIDGGSSVTTSRSMGRGVMVIDAVNGSLLWQAGASVSGATHDLTVAGMDYSISSDVTVIDMNRDGIQDTGYVGDNGGNLWRLNLNDNDPANWTVQQVAAVGAHSAPERRKFQYPPDVVFSKDAGGNFNAVLLGSGDREHPFDTTVTDRFYLFKDRASGTPITDSDVFDATAATGSNSYGYKITMTAGEKVISSAVTVSGITYFNTNQPSESAGSGACGANLGIARQYSISYQDAAAANTTVSGTEITARASIHPGGGFLPSPVPVLVRLNEKNYVGVVSGTSVQTPPTPTLDVRSRTFWFIELR
ncbi:MAG: pilus assembly protein PilY [Betaproteobacteria bacterium]|nr:MAG: pilus assembly protein PilY [Betaproteobacteria bacterium]